MNERFLCKAKRLDNGEWITGNVVFDWSPFERENTIRSAMIREPLGPIGETHVIDTKTLCQCTGLKDKNGVLIFEGDIVSTLINYGPGGDHLQEIEVTFDKKHGGWSWQEWVFDNNKTLPTVIGNIHDKEYNND